MAIHSTVLRGLFVGLCAFTALAHAEIHKSHAIAMHGEPMYSAGFSHFDYTNPDAPKGGELRLRRCRHGVSGQLLPVRFTHRAW